MAIDSVQKRQAMMGFGGPGAVPITSASGVTAQERAIYLGLYSVSGSDDDDSGGVTTGDVGPWRRRPRSRL